MMHLYTWRVKKTKKARSCMQVNTFLNWLSLVGNTRLLSKIDPYSTVRTPDTWNQLSFWDFQIPKFTFLWLGHWVRAAFPCPSQVVLRDQNSRGTSELVTKTPRMLGERIIGKINLTWRESFRRATWNRTVVWKQKLESPHMARQGPRDNTAFWRKGLVLRVSEFSDFFTYCSYEI